MTQTIPAGPWTVDDLDAFPDCPTVRYELIDGALLVTSEPTLQHQRVTGALWRLLQDAAPSDVEVQSPSTRTVDLTLKRQVLQEAAVGSYWLVEPDELVLTVLELVGGTYEQVARVQGDQAYEAARPFPVRVVPAGLSG